MFIGSVIPFLHHVLDASYTEAIIDATYEGDGSELDALDFVGMYCGV